jgi:chromosome partitioning protein
MLKAIVITVANQKGGVAKTTTVINLGHGLARTGRKVLLLDLDPQGQVASSLGIENGPGMDYFLTMRRNTPQEIKFLRDQIQSSGRKNLWLIPGDEGVSSAQSKIQREEKPVTYIRDCVDLFKKDFDYILIDTPPSLGGLHERGLWAADLALIPTTMDVLSTEGVVKVIKALRTLYQEKGWRGKLLGVLPTMYDEVTIRSRRTLEQLKTTFSSNGRNLLLPLIHEATVFRDASATSQTIFEMAPSSRAAYEYQEVVKAVLRMQ